MQQHFKNSPYIVIMRYIKYYEDHNILFDNERLPKAKKNLQYCVVRTSLDPY